MVELNKKELAKLPPAERIKKLKEIEEANKKEIKEAEELIKKSEAELETAEVEKKVSVPEIKPVDISDLFEPPPSELEQTAQEAQQEEMTPEQAEYLVNQAYEEVRELAYQAPSDDILNRLDELGEVLEKAIYRTPTKELANKAVSTRALIYKIRRYFTMDEPTW